MAIYVHNSLAFKIPKIQSIKSSYTECECTEIIRQNAKNIIVSCICQSPRNDPHKFLNKIKTFVYKYNEKPLFLVGDLQ